MKKTMKDSKIIPITRINKIINKFIKKNKNE